MVYLLAGRNRLFAVRRSVASVWLLPGATHRGKHKTASYTQFVVVAGAAICHPAAALAVRLCDIAAEQKAVCVCAVMAMQSAKRAGE